MYRQISIRPSIYSSITNHFPSFHGCGGSAVNPSRQQTRAGYGTPGTLCLSLSGPQQLLMLTFILMGQYLYYFNSIGSLRSMYGTVSMQYGLVLYELRFPFVLRHNYAHKQSVT